MNAEAYDDRVRGALWRMVVGDALAMPVHWYYDVAALQRNSGTIRDYQAPKDYHPSSIMSLASTGRAGRGPQEGEVVGGVICKGKKSFWCRPNTHYHQEIGDRSALKRAFPQPSTRRVQDGIHIFILEASQQPARDCRRHDHQFDLPPRRFLAYLRHDR